MNVILLSGGSGKRLWPLSNDVRSKQFIRFFQKENGEHESMLERVFRQIKKADPNARITIAGAKTQLSSIRNQLGDDVSISVEPTRRDTFPAIVLATAYLNEVQGISDEETAVVCPVDPFVSDDYFTYLNRLSSLAENSEARLSLLGIQPSYPSEKYGYIIPKTQDEVSEVLRFQEKPNQTDAMRFIQQGALWNAGVFAYRVGDLLETAHKLLRFTGYRDLFEQYASLPKISFDYAVVEKEPHIQVLRFPGEWKDVGTWNTLTESMGESIIGNAITGENCDNVHIINELSIPVLAAGLKDIVISASPEGILVSDKNASSYIKPYVDQLKGQIMFAEKSWGSYQVINIERGSLTIRVNLNPGHRMHYHSHQKRDEVWTVVQGEGSCIVDGVEQKIHVGDTISIKAGQKHMIIAETALILIEIQLGDEISVEDKQKFPLEISQSR